jgi:tetratricopeptide (TPR) repeat protein
MSQPNLIPDDNIGQIIDEPCCVICLGSVPVPIQRGCACRGDSGLSHVLCMVRYAELQEAHHGVNAWKTCRTCKQPFTGAMRRELAETLVDRYYGRRRLRLAHSEDESGRLDAELNLAESLVADGKYVEAVRIMRRVLQNRERTLPIDDIRVLETKSVLAWALSTQRPDEAERLNRDALAVHRRIRGDEHPNTLTLMSNLATNYINQGKLADAESLEREILVVRRRVLGPEHPHTLSTASNLSVSLAMQGKHAEAESIVRELLAVRRRVLGEHHPNTLVSAGNLVSALLRQGKNDEAEGIARELLEVCRRVLGEHHPNTLVSAGNLVTALFNQGKNAEADALKMEFLR